MPGKQVTPYHDVSVFYFSEPRINVFLARISLRLGENAIEVGGIGFILPVMLEGVDIGLDGSCHRSNMPGKGGIRHRATLNWSDDVIPARTSCDWRMKMRLMLSVLTGAALLGIVPAANAQQKEPKKEKEPKTSIRPEGDGCITKEGRTECVFRRMNFDSAMQKRPAIGVQTNSTGTSRDSIGLFVARVVPNGPAEKAGIVEGDRLVSINGVDLRVNAADAGDDFASQLPIRRLTREVGKLNPGHVATMRVWSGGRIRDVQVTVGRASDLREAGGAFGGMYGIPEGMMFPGFDGMRTQLRALPMERMRLREMPLEGERFRILAPSRVRVFSDGEWHDREKVEKTLKEKEKSEKKKN